MGVSYYAVSGIGVLLNFDDLDGPEVHRPSCPHPEAFGNKFCPVCGVQVRTIVEQNSDFANEVKETLESARLPADYIFHFADYESRKYFLGWGKSASSWRSEDFEFTKLSEVPSFDQVRDTIKSILVKLKEDIPDCPDLFDEDDFGYWTGIAVS